MTNTTPSLAQQIEAAITAFMADLPEADAQVVAESFAQSNTSNVTADAVTVGAIAPDFLLPDASGATVRLYDRLAGGPVVLSFYRGGWCPFCSLELQALQARLSDMEALGASLVAVSPETPDNSLSTRQKHQLGFDVLSDIGNRVARDYGLLSSVYEAMRPLYLKWGLDVPAANGDNSWELPVPATYLIDSRGRIRGAHVDRDYTRRMDPEDIVALLRDLREQ